MRVLSPALSIILCAAATASATDINSVVTTTTLVVQGGGQVVGTCNDTGAGLRQCTGDNHYAFCNGVARAGFLDIWSYSTPDTSCTYTATRCVTTSAARDTVTVSAAGHAGQTARLRATFSVDPSLAVGEATSPTATVNVNIIRQGQPTQTLAVANASGQLTQGGATITIGQPFVVEFSGISDCTSTSNGGSGGCQGHPNNFARVAITLSSLSVVDDQGNVIPCTVQASSGNSYGAPTPPRCPADLDNGSGQGAPDGAVTIDDLMFFLRQFSAASPAADLDNGSGNGVPDGGITVDDLIYFLSHFAGGC